MTGTFDAVVIGGGVIGAAIAFHLTKLGCRDVALIERERIAAGTTAQSSGLLRAHYSVAANMAMAKASLEMFDRFDDLLEDREASAGVIRCGYLIVAPPGKSSEAVREAIARQSALGIEARIVDATEARSLHPWLSLDDIDAIGWEPNAGFADPNLTATSFARAAKRQGATILEGAEVTGLIRNRDRIEGVATDTGPIRAGITIAAMNVWTGRLGGWLGMDLRCVATRHDLASFACDEPYTPRLPIVKDLASPGLIYTRSTSGSQILVGTGDEGSLVENPDHWSAEIPLDWVLAQGEALSRRMPKFAEARLAATWSGLYDTTPDWNPVLGPLPGIAGLSVAFGFSGHGFKLSPMVGRIVAQDALNLPTDLPIAPYRFARFAEGHLLTGSYGAGAVS